MLGAGIVHGRLVEVETIVGGGLRGIIATRRSRLVGEGGSVSSHLAIVIIIARRAWRRVSLEKGKPNKSSKKIELEHTLGRLRPIIESALGVLRRADQDRVIGMGLDVFLQVLRTLEGLAAELTLVRLQGHVDTDVRGDVVSLDRGGTA